MKRPLKGLAHRLTGSVLFWRGYMTIEQVIKILPGLEVKSIKKSHFRLGKRADD